MVALEEIRDVAMWTVLVSGIATPVLLLLRQQQLFILSFAVLALGLAILLACIVIERLRELRRERKVLEKVY